MELTKEIILKSLEKKRDDIRKCGVKRLGLFGSFARGDSTPASDLDFVVEFEKKSFDGLMDLKECLEAEFGRSVDLVTADVLKPRLQSNILDEVIHAPGL